MGSRHEILYDRYGAYCNEDSMSKFLRIVLSNDTQYGYDSEAKNGVGDCYTANDEKHEKYDIDLYVFLLLQIALFATVIFSTLYSYFKPKINGNTFFTNVVTSFDMKRCARDLFDIGPNELNVLHGIRFLSACIIVYFHVYAFHLIPNLIKDSYWDRNPKKPYLAIIYHAHVVVDTFFMISGLLLARSTLTNIGKPINIVNVLIKRYFRLMCAFINILMLSGLLLKYVLSGPIYENHVVVDLEMCTRYWWRNMLMINNYVDPENMCYNVSWSIPADFHLTIIGISLLWLYQTNRRAGILTFTVLLITSVILPGVVTYVNRLAHSPAFDYVFAVNFRKTLFPMQTYTWSHLRAGPYFVGIALGYIMTFYSPSKYRNYISKKWSTAGGMVVLATFLTILYLMEVLYHRPYDVLEASVFAASFRTVWALAVALLVVVCEYGDFPLVSSFLNWSAFVPLSRLSYGQYLVSNALIIWHITSVANPKPYGRFYLFQNNLLMTTLSIFFSFIQWFYLESPMGNFVGRILRSKPTKTEEMDMKKTEMNINNNNFKGAM